MVRDSAVYQVPTNGFHLEPVEVLVELTLEPGDLGLLGGEFADVGAGRFALQHPGVALLAPRADQRGVQPLPTQLGLQADCCERLDSTQPDTQGRVVIEGADCPCGRLVVATITKVDGHRGLSGTGQLACP